MFSATPDVLQSFRINRQKTHTLGWLLMTGQISKVPETHTRPLYRQSPLWHSCCFSFEDSGNLNKGEECLFL